MPIEASLFACAALLVHQLRCTCPGDCLSAGHCTGNIWYEQCSTCRPLVPVPSSLYCGFDRSSEAEAMLIRGQVMTALQRGALEEDGEITMIFERYAGNVN